MDVPPILTWLVYFALGVVVCTYFALTLVYCTGLGKKLNAKKEDVDLIHVKIF